MKTKVSRRRFRTFCAAFMLTVCLLMLGCGFLVVEYNTRRTAFGDSRLRLEYRMEGGKLTARTPAADTEYVLPDWAQAWAGRVWTVVPARIRAAAWLSEAEQAAAPIALQWLLGIRDDRK